MDVVRRPLITEPGDVLVMPSPPLEAANRYQSFCDSFGLEPEETVISPLVGMPLPLYPPRWPGARRRWSQVRPEVMWHPLMWLPPRVASRAVLERDADGEITSLEDRDLWAVRVMIEVSFGGLYDVETGTWVDVLSMYGLDISTFETQQRVKEWLSGAPDSLLDSIDLSKNLDVPGDLWWALDSASGLADSMWVVNWARAAEELIGVVEDLIGSVTASTVEQSEVEAVIGMVCATARSSFAYVPPADELVHQEDAGPRVESAHGDLVPDTEDTFWADAYVKASDMDYADTEAVGRFVETLLTRLGALRDFYLPQVDHFVRQSGVVERSLAADPSGNSVDDDLALARAQEMGIEAGAETTETGTPAGVGADIGSGDMPPDPFAPRHAAS